MITYILKVINHLEERNANYHVVLSVVERLICSTLFRKGNEDDKEDFNTNLISIKKALLDLQDLRNNLHVSVKFDEMYRNPRCLISKLIRNNDVDEVALIKYLYDYMMRNCLDADAIFMEELSVSAIPLI